jgi:hypothetical protein
MKDGVEFSEKEKITIIQHTAQGLQYLHDSSTGISSSGL